MGSITEAAASGSTAGRRIELVIAVSVITVTSAVSGLNVALPAVAEDTGATQSELVWIVDAYTVTLAGLLLSAGALGDRFGRKLILTIGLVTFGGAALVAAFVTDPTALMACRAVMGAGAAFVLPSTLSIITTVLPAGERSAAVGLWVGLAGAGAVVGLFGSAILLEFFWWGSVFVLSAVFATIALIGALSVLPATKADDPPRLDLIGAGLSLGGIGLLVFGIIEGPDEGWSDPVVLAALIGGVVLLVALVVHELRTPGPMIDPRLFANRGVQTGSLSISVLFFTFFGFIFLITQYLQFVAGLSTIEVALALVPFAVVMVPMSRFSPRLAATHGPNRLTTLGFVLLAGGFAILAFLDVDFRAAVLVPGLVVLATGMALIAAPSTTAIVGSLPTGKQGVAAAVSDTSREVGGALGVAVLGSILNAVYASSLDDQLPDSVPAEAASAAEDSIAVAHAAADRLGGPGQALAEAASQSYVDGFRTALVVAVVLALCGAVHAALRAPGTPNEL